MQKIQTYPSQVANCHRIWEVISRIWEVISRIWEVIRTISIIRAADAAKNDWGVTRCGKKKNKMHKTHLWCNTNAKFPKIESQKPKKSLILFRNAKDIDLSQVANCHRIWEVISRIWEIISRIWEVIRTISIIELLTQLKRKGRNAMRQKDKSKMRKSPLWCNTNAKYPKTEM